MLHVCYNFSLPNDQISKYYFLTIYKGYFNRELIKTSRISHSRKIKKLHQESETRKMYSISKSCGDVLCKYILLQKVKLLYLFQDIKKRSSLVCYQSLKIFFNFLILGSCSHYCIFMTHRYTVLQHNYIIFLRQQEVL